jgi:hypothetical protein
MNLARPYEERVFITLIIVPEGFSIIHITTKEFDTCPQARCYIYNIL